MPKELIEIVNQAGKTAFADEYGVSRSTVYKWIQREQQMSFEWAEHLSPHLGISVSELIRQTMPLESA